MWAIPYLKVPWGLRGVVSVRLAGLVAQSLGHHVDVVKAVDPYGKTKDRAGIAAGLEGVDSAALGYACQQFGVLARVSPDVENHAFGINQAGEERVHPFVVLLERRLEGMGDVGGLGPPSEVAQMEVLHHRVFRQRNGHQHIRIQTNRCPAEAHTLTRQG